MKIWHWSDDHALTLVELLATIVISSFVMLAGVGLYQSVSRLWVHTVVTANVTQDGNNAINLIADELHHAVSASVLDNGLVLQIQRYQGEVDEIRQNGTTLAFSSGAQQRILTQRLLSAHWSVSSAPAIVNLTLIVGTAQMNQTFTVSIPLTT